MQRFAGLDTKGLIMHHKAGGKVGRYTEDTLDYIYFLLRNLCEKNQHYYPDVFGNESSGTKQRKLLVTNKCFVFRSSCSFSQVIPI